MGRDMTTDLRNESRLPTRLGGRRSCLALLVAFLMTVTIGLIDVPGASATTLYGEAAGATINVGGDAVSSGVNCNVSGYWSSAAGASTMHVDGKCSTGWNVSDASLILSTTGGCLLSYDAGQVDGGATFAGTMVGGGLCSAPVTQLCYDVALKFHSNPFNTQHFDDCVPWLVGSPPASPPESPGDCGGTSIPAPVVSAPVYIGKSWSGPVYLTSLPTTDRVDPTTAAYAMYQSVTYDLTGMPVGSAPAPYAGLYAVMELTTGGGYLALNGHSGTSTSPVRYQFSIPASASITIWYLVTQGSAGAVPGYELAGVGAFRRSTGLETQSVGISSPTMATSGTAGTQNVYGRTIRSACELYWGTAAASTGTTADTPVGPYSAPITGPSTAPPTTTAPPPATDDSCSGFSLSDPSSWASAGVCAVAQAIAGLVGLVGRVLDWLDGFVGLLTSLFVPKGTEVSASWSGLVSTVENRPPWSLVAALGASIGGFVGAFTSAGDCGSLLDFGAGMDVTCSAVKNSPGMAGLYALVQAGIIGVGAFAAFRIVTGAFKDGDD